MCWSNSTFNLISHCLFCLQNTWKEQWRTLWVARHLTCLVTQPCPSMQASVKAYQLEWWLWEESLMKSLFLTSPTLMRRSGMPMNKLMISKRSSFISWKVSLYKLSESFSVMKKTKDFYSYSCQYINLSVTITYLSFFWLLLRYQDSYELTPQKRVSDLFNFSRHFLFGFSRSKTLNK